MKSFPQQCVHDDIRQKIEDWSLKAHQTEARIKVANSAKLPDFLCLLVTWITYLFFYVGMCVHLRCPGVVYSGVVKNTHLEQSECTTPRCALVWRKCTKKVGFDCLLLHFYFVMQVCVFVQTSSVSVRCICTEVDRCYFDVENDNGLREQTTVACWHRKTHTVSAMKSAMRRCLVKHGWVERQLVKATWATCLQLQLLCTYKLVNYLCVCVYVYLRVRSS